MEIFAKWSAFIALIVSLVRNVYFITSHVSTKSGIVHSVQKKKFDYRQNFLSLDEKMMEQLLSLSLLCFWWIGADCHLYAECCF